MQRHTSAVHATATSNDGTGAGAVLKHDHELLEASYARLLETYHGGDWAEVRREWKRFEVALRRHMRAEEDQVLAAFRAEHAEEAAAIQAEHDELRAHLDAFGVLVELHAFTLPHAEILIERLRAHAAREERLFYPWSSRAIGEDAVARRLRAAG